MKKYAVISENDTSIYNDTTGIFYEFPKMYREILTQGTQVVYYKGRERDKKFRKLRLTKEAHYFGYATIGKVEENGENLLAHIEDYSSFDSPVLAKDERDFYIEFNKPAHKDGRGLFIRGVRRISEETYHRILSKELIISDAKKRAKPIYSLSPEQLLKKLERQSEIGLMGENIALEYEVKRLMNAYACTEDEAISAITLHANLDVTKGFDLETKFKNEHRCIEVKASSSGSKKFYFSRNEFQILQEMDEKSWIYFIEMKSKNDWHLTEIHNPFKNKSKTDFEIMNMLASLDQFYNFK